MALQSLKHILKKCNYKHDLKPMLHSQHTQLALTQYIHHLRQCLFEVSHWILFHIRTTFIDAVSVFRSVSVL
jgi:hypothetical protein